MLHEHKIITFMILIEVKRTKVTKENFRKGAEKI